MRSGDAFGVVQPCTLLATVWQNWKLTFQQRRLIYFEPEAPVRDIGDKSRTVLRRPCAF